MDWDRILDEHGAALIMYARQWTHCHTDAEDIVQAAILKLHKSDPNASEIPKWKLYVATKQCALDNIKMNKRRANRESNAADDLYGEMVFDQAFDFDTEQAVQKALHRLPDQQREVLIMKIWGQQTFKEIGLALDIPLNTATARYRYAIEKLEPILEEMGVNYA